METAENMAAAFEAEAGTAPVVNVSGVDAPAVTTTETARAQKFYTDEDLAKVRSQEKEKLYPQIDSLKEELLALKKEKEEEAIRRSADAEAEAARIREEALAELDSKSYADARLSELQEQLERERVERERAFALLEREKQYADLQAYRQEVLEQERDNIIPELVDLISGNTREELASSVEGLKERSARILESAQAAMQNARKEMKGTSITTPPAGPMETNSEQRMLSPEEIAALPMNEYAKYRSRLLSPKAQGRTQGILG
jgi:DNA repair exonuclease SbcCD ATPase subunit